MNLSTVPSEVFQEAAKIAARRAASALAEILCCPVGVSFDEIILLDLSEFQSFLQSHQDPEGTAISIHFTGGVSGNAYFLLHSVHVREILQIISDQDAGIIEEAGGASAVLVEIGNIVLNMYAGTVMNQLATHVVYETPQLFNRSEIVENMSLPSTETKFQVLTSHLSFDGKEVVGYILLSFQQDK